ncbi:helix-turn-helix domain-containing protein, partial [Variovorax paradoxus]|uniref:helix-turn-helix domain-containing protein n=1 Tax=Variovorax paradoxus TaxID=34073 RepID=UPI0027864D65
AMATLAATITMTMRGADRLKTIQAVVDRMLWVGQAAQRLGLSRRQLERLVQRYKDEGVAALARGRARHVRAVVARAQCAAAVDAAGGAARSLTRPGSSRMDQLTLSMPGIRRIDPKVSASAPPSPSSRAPRYVMRGDVPPQTLREPPPPMC